MASVTCAPCAFGAVATSLLSFPISIATLSVSVVPVVSFGNDSLPTTTFLTSTLSPLTTATTPPGAPAVTTITYTNVDQLTWTTLGATLSFPTTYVEYLGFAGAAVTGGAGCASTIAPTPVNIPASVPTASLIWPLDRTGGLPGGLLSYLDSVPAFIGQLGGNRLETCAAAGAVPVSGTANSVVITQTSTLPVTSTVVTTIPPPTTYTTTGAVTETGTVTIPASNAVTGTVGLLVSTYQGPTVVISGSATTTVPLQSQVIGGSTTARPFAAAELSSLLAILSSKSVAARISSSGLYTNSTSATASTSNGPVSVPSSRTASASNAAYSGAATQTTPKSNSAWWNVLGSLGFVLLL